MRRVTGICEAGPGDAAFVQMDYPASSSRLRTGIGRNARRPHFALAIGPGVRMHCRGGGRGAAARCRTEKRGDACPASCIRGDSLIMGRSTPGLLLALGYLWRSRWELQEQVSLSHELLAGIRSGACAQSQRRYRRYRSVGHFPGHWEMSDGLKRQARQIFVGEIPNGGLQRPSARCLRPSHSRLTSCGTVTNLACSIWTWGVSRRHARCLPRQRVFPYASPSIVPVLQKSVCISRNEV